MKRLKVILLSSMLAFFFARGLASAEGLEGFGDVVSQALKDFNNPGEYGPSWHTGSAGGPLHDQLSSDRQGELAGGDQSHEQR